jgi:5-methylcytosine-specific restriction protein B
MKPPPPAPSRDETVAALAKETRFPERLLRDLHALLERRGQVAIEGPTGVGKTHLARRLAAAFAGSAQRVRVVQFHPSFRYEDFIEGHAAPGAAPGTAGAAPAAPLPGLLSANQGPERAAHPAAPGLLTSFAARAARDPQQRYVMVLDDLGRGDAVAVLGEVFSLLEFREQEVVLPYSREAFSLPKNLFFVATASATHQARALAEPALRRRFPFVHLEPSADVLRAWLEERRPEMAHVADLFVELNKRLAKEAGPLAQIGQSIFMQPELDEAELERIFAYDVRPLLEPVVDAAKLSRFDLAALKKAAKS